MSRIPRFYAGYGLLLLWLYAVASWRGWSFTKVEEARDLPKTVRDNPGAYRSHYAGRSHHFGGK